VEFRDRVAALTPSDSGSDAVIAIADRGWEQFAAAMDDDLNVPGAVGAAFAAIRDINRELDSGPLSAAARQRLLRFVADVDDIIGVLPLVDRDSPAELEPELGALLQQREEARARKDFAASDRLRGELLDRGIIVEDTPQGQRWKRR
jgi:cysteinyl-tRNA synthetase